MAVIWGLDLKEVHWSKLKFSYMFKNRDYHLRRTKFGIYQGAMIPTMIAQSLGTTALTNYLDQQEFVAAHSPGATVHNNNFIGIASYLIFVGVFTVNFFTIMFVLDIFWPERHESKAVRKAWRVCSVFSCLLTLSCALAYTYIVATQSAFVSGTDSATADRLIAEFGRTSTLRYASNPRALASVILLWLGMVFTFLSTALLWHSLAHTARFGPKSTHAREADEAFGDKPQSFETRGGGEGALDVPGQPPPTHATPGATA
ncbi:uncharacterized protein EKO05_0003260 [Ascochyta rabiei]|uniref:Uncharacterized protein n=1 Tax=Didymella rabiei TaxID=5454 RepID=A0A163I7T8_DIDRA|nr:uncharacterized protein EKO05_0003260 [Ascochyta rabiei]KZM25641.1 hypothetical protein ST47_g3201 [Ascochyta rabiei]UPX12721.1 hypothetical protein EKO05_0003260 [Ascochyta rabiei]